MGKNMISKEEVMMMLAEIEKAVQEKVESGKSCIIVIPHIMNGMETMFSRRFGVSCVCSSHVKDIVVLEERESFFNGFSPDCFYIDESSDG